MGDDSAPRTVLSTCWGLEQLFLVSYNGDDGFSCNSSHILTLINDISIIEMYDCKYDYAVKYFCPKNKGIELKYCKNLRSAVLSKYAIEKMYGMIDLTLDDYIISKCRLQMTKRKPVSHWPEGKYADDEYYDTGANLKNSFYEIPGKYLKSSISQRTFLLAGLLDTNKILGDYKDYYMLRFPTSNRPETIETLLYSLGLDFKTYLAPDSIIIKIKGYYETPVDLPLRITKKVLLKKTSKNINFKISLTEYDNRYYGFEIDGNRRFCLSDFTVTHNTVLAIKMIKEFGQKALIVVNKTELARQWRAELTKFIPGIKIGTIQGATFDVEGCQVVIGMLQSIAMKDHLTHEKFKCFSVGILDECHNISSEVFSKIMFKVRPKHLFGLTATLERKDQMEKIIKWYLGDVIYSDQSSSLKQTSDIHVYKYKGKSSVEKFLRTGDPACSEMLTNISEDRERTNVVVNILKRLLLEKDRNILVLSDRTAQLKQIYKQFPEDSGLFIGSKKPEELLEAKKHRILLGTYGMCNEGFSLEKLNTLVFATPRSSITQAIGRIYRKKHVITPLIVDIVDDFSIFKGQSYKRKKIYRDSISKPFILEKNTIDDTVKVQDLFEEVEEDFAEMCMIHSDSE
jgi:superfamily II DNA or RNA helicase